LKREEEDDIALVLVALRLAMVRRDEVSMVSGNCEEKLR
jgi:hypothetical protein